MPNIGMIIKNKNMKLLSNDTNSEKRCSCRNKNNCPLNGKCLSKSLVYEAEVKTDTENFRYIGLCEGDFKTRYNTHVILPQQKILKQHRSLEENMYTKNENIKHTVSWKTVQTTRARKCGLDRCNFCLADKFHILISKNNGLLNKRSELISKCRHINKHLLTNTNSLLILFFPWLFIQYFSMFMFLV